MTEQEKPFWKKKFFYVVAGVIIIALVLIVTSASRNTEVTKPVSKMDDKHVQAETVAKNIVSTYLKSPASAQFATLLVTDVHGSKNALQMTSNDAVNEYVAFGDVDSQNSFGALLRTHFYLLLTYRGGDASDAKRWEVKSLELDNRLLVSDGKVLDQPLPASETWFENFYTWSDKLVKLRVSRDQGVISENDFRKAVDQTLKEMPQSPNP